jgi:hypothetical protein
MHVVQSRRRCVNCTCQHANFYVPTQIVSSVTVGISANQPTIFLSHMKSASTTENLTSIYFTHNESTTNHQQHSAEQAHIVSFALRIQRSPPNNPSLHLMGVDWKKI